MLVVSKEQVTALHGRDVGEIVGSGPMMQNPMGGMPGMGPCYNETAHQPELVIEDRIYTSPCCRSRLQPKKTSIHAAGVISLAFPSRDEHSAGGKSTVEKFEIFFVSLRRHIPHP